MTDTSSTPLPTTPEPDAHLTRYNDHRRREAELLPVNKAALLQALADAGVSFAVVTFDGYGDSGQIEGVEARAGDRVVDFPDRSIEIADAIWDQPEPKRYPLTLRDAVESIARDVLTATHGGWENNEGGYGEVVFDVSAGEIRLDCNVRFIDTEHSQHVF